MLLNGYGEYEPSLDEFSRNTGRLGEADAASVCPFLLPELNEDELAKQRFAEWCDFDARIGYHHATFAGHALEGEFRSQGTSGGLGTWIAAELLSLGHIDGVIHVKPVQDRSQEDPLFAYQVSRSVEEIREGAKTRYHVVEMSQVMTEVRSTPGRYLFFGVPCMCKAVRRLQEFDSIISERIAFVVSLVCGHLKSLNWTLSLAWGSGIPPENLLDFQYRTKGPGIPARSYVFRAIARNPEQPVVQRNAATVVGGKYNAGAMMPSACDYCDDVVGETADLTIGDAWLPRFDVNDGGTNLLIVRNPALREVLQSAAESERISIEAISATEAGDSQAGGFRHRREGLSYRLAREAAAGNWTPEKRVKPGQYRVSRLRRRIYDVRSLVATKSREAFRRALDAGEYTLYVEAMQPILKKLRRLQIRSAFLRGGWKRIQRLFLRVTTQLRRKAQ
jgi:coenzyme F420-reducing hydrogenase beta subunit